MQITILGNGALGRAVEHAAADAGHTALVVGRPGTGRHPPADLQRSDVVVEASRAEAVLGNVRSALEAGSTRLVIATTGWSADRPLVDATLREFDAAAVAAANFSIGVALFGRLVDTAVDLFGALPAFDPYLVEWHRRTKVDRPSGTAGELARRILARHPAKGRLAEPSNGPPDPDALEVVSVRAGASPGMHLVGFDASGETVELRLIARDRSAYTTGILAAADWLMREPRPAGIHDFDPIVDDVLATPASAAGPAFERSFR